MASVLLDGVSCAAHDLALGGIQLFVIPRRERKSESILGSLTAHESEEWAYAPTPILFQLLAKGADREAVLEKFRAASAWLMNARELRLSTDPARYYLGSVQNVDKVRMLSLTTGRLDAEFVCNPPCWHKVRTSDANFKPNHGMRLPEQITAGNATASCAFTEPGNMTSVTYSAAHPAALFFAVEGTFDSLTLGGASGLVINWETPQSMTVYIDCVAQVVYHMLGGVITAIPYSGDFPVLNQTGQIAVGGTNLNVTVRMLVIERG